MDEQLTAPDPAPSPRSGLKTAARRFCYWIKAVVLRLEAPSPGVYAELVDRLRDAQRDLLATQVELAIAKARYDIAEKQVVMLGEVIERDRERVHAETAGAAARRERLINEAGEMRRARNAAAGDDG